MTDWTPQEMMAVAAARLIADGDVAIVGLGLPQVAAMLAKRTHAPTAAMMLEIGVYDPVPRESAMGIADPRLWESARAFGGMIDVLGHSLHRGRVTLGILGALEVDATGSINSSLVVQDDGTERRFNGSGGGNDIASLAGRVIVVMRHESRKFKQRVRFLTSPGRSVDGESRTDLGLPGLGTTHIVTDRAVLAVEAEGLALESIHPNENVDALMAATPIPLIVNAAPCTEAPSADQLDLIRSELDPLGWYTS